MSCSVCDHGGLAYLDERIYNTYQSQWGTPMVLVGDRMEYEPTNEAVPDGPGAFVAPAILERGFQAYFGAPGYYVDDPPGEERYLDEDPIINMSDYQPQVMSEVGHGGNPWDYMFGTIGSYGLDTGVGVRDWPDQSGEYSLS